jgi:methionyl-tRNA synthetase
MYVWVDALTNYLTGLGYPEKTPEMEPGGLPTSI